MNEKKDAIMIDCVATGQRIKGRRKAMCMSVCEFARQLGVHRIAVHKWESGDNFPDLNHVYMMSRILRCRMEDLVAGK